VPANLLRDSSALLRGKPTPGVEQCQQETEGASATCQETKRWHRGDLFARLVVGVSTVAISVAVTVLVARRVAIAVSVPVAVVGLGVVWSVMAW
jgi:hypothetical protein